MLTRSRRSNEVGPFGFNEHLDPAELRRIDHTHLELGKEHVASMERAGVGQDLDEFKGSALRRGAGGDRMEQQKRKRRPEKAPLPSNGEWRCRTSIRSPRKRAASVV